MAGSMALQAAELATIGFSDPTVLLAAGGAAVAGVTADLFKHRQETQAGASMPVFADPEAAEAAGVNNRRTRFAERLGHYAAVAFATLAFVQLSGPYENHAKMKGDASIVLDAGYGADVRDMQGANGSRISRLQAGIEGSLAAAKDNPVPFSFIVEGSSAQVVDSTPAHGKDLSRTRKRISQALNPTFRNGESLVSGTQDALSLSGSHANDVIMITSNVGTHSGNDLQALRARIRHEYPEDSLHAIVVGAGNGHEQVGLATLNAPVSKKLFQRILGSENVMTAHSTNQVRSDITSIVNEAQATETRRPVKVPEQLAALVAVLGMGLSVSRRLSGISKFFSRKGGRS